MDHKLKDSATSTWVSRLWGELEPQLVKHIQYDDTTGILATPTGLFSAGKFTCYGVDQLIRDAELNIRLLKLKGLVDSTTGAYPTVAVVTGVDVGAAILDSEEGAIFQVASQFNCLEMPHPGVSPSAGITNYPADPTQGPRAVLACAPGLLVRNHYYPNTNLLDDMDLSCHNGYLLWGEQPEQVLAKLDPHKIKIGVMDDTGMVGITLKDGRWVLHQQDKLVTQVFTAAAPVNCYRNGGDLTTQLEIAKTLITAQYQGIIAYAIRNITDVNNIPPLHLTLLGAGAFGVPLHIVVEALSQALRSFSYPLPVALHCYRASDAAHLRGLEWNRWKVVLYEEPLVEYPLRNHQCAILSELLKLQRETAPGTLGTFQYHSPENAIEQISSILHCKGDELWYINIRGQRRTIVYSL